MTGAPDPLPVEKDSSGHWLDSVSLIWIVPLLALAIALGAIWQNYSERGPLIQVRFADASGIRPDETELRFRDIGVGLVEKIEFTDDLSQVVVSIRVEKHLAPYIDADAQFWVVRPEVTTQGVRGLDTVLSGVYIQGSWDDRISGESALFDGLDEEPLMRVGESGVTFRIFSDDSLPTSETPILYKGVEVGRLDTPKISDDGARVVTTAVVFEPYDQLISSSTRFWNVSGFSFKINSGGAQLDFSSLASLVTGGITFATFSSGGVPLQDETEFELHPDEDTAREDYFLHAEGVNVDLMMVFAENPPGLAVGAPVELGGLAVGEVTAISGLVDIDRFGDPGVRLLASMRINAGRVGLGSEADETELLDYLDLRLAEGLRGRLTNASLLTGGLKIELVEVPGAAPAAIDRAASPFPAIPTDAAEIADVTATAQHLLQRANDLPVEELLASTIGFLEAGRNLLASDDLRAAPTDLRATLVAIRDVATSDAVQGLPDQVAGAAEDLRSVVARANALLAALDEQDAVAKLVAAIESLTASADAVPDLMADARALLQKAADLPLEQLTSEVSELLASADALLTQDSTRAIPDEVNATLEDLRQTLASVRDVAQGDAVESLTTELADASARLNALLARIETDNMVGQVSTTLTSIDSAAAAFPPLTDDARALIAQARALPLDELTTEVTDLLEATRQIVDQGSARALPSEITAALGELRDTLQSVRSIAEGEDLRAIPTRVVALTDDLRGVTTRITDLIATFEDNGAAETLTAAIADLASAAEDLPALVDQARGILTQAGDLPLDDLATRASDLLASAEAILDQPSARQVPEELNGALSALRGTLEEFRAGGVVENTNAALASAREAAEAVAQASASLPELSERLGRLAAQAQTTLTGYDRTSEFSRDMLAAIRQINAAAEAVYRLSRQIERNPNSLLFGR